MNLLQETKDDILKNGKTIEDIIYIGLNDGSYSVDGWDSFEQIADIKYDAGYGGNEINRNLVIIFKDLSRLIRGEYDGLEWWEYNTIEVPAHGKEMTAKTLTRSH